MATLTKVFFLGLLFITEIAFAGQVKNIDANQLSGTLLDKPKLIKDFGLKNTEGGAFTPKSLKGHWTLLFFGFTRCGYVCPTSLAALKQVYEDLQKTAAPKPQVIFISIDPQRDDLPRIQKYVTAFNKNFIGATGNNAELNTLTSQLGILYMKIIHREAKRTASDNYDIDHSGSILLIDPDGELIAVFSMPHQAKNIVKDYKTIVSNYS